MRVLVTGGNGFIGGYVVAELLARGHSPFIFDRRFSPNPPADSFLGDIRDRESVREAMAHAEGWIHLAGVLGTQETIQYPMTSAETNVLGGLNVLEAADQYGVPGVNIAVGNHWMDNTYSITKSTVERFVRMYQTERETPVASVRAYNAYGPGQSIAAPYGESKVRKIVPSFACRALTGAPIEIYGDGSQIMDMIHVADVASILVETLGRVAGGEVIPEPVQAGSGERTTVRQIALLVRTAAVGFLGVKSEIVHLPMRPGEPEKSVVLADAPHRPDELVSLPEGIAETVIWYAREWLPSWRG